MDSPVHWECREADQHTTLCYGRSIEVCIRLRFVSDFWSECAGPKLRLLGQTPSITVPTTWLIQYPLTFLADASGGSDLTRNSITGCPGPFRACRMSAN